MLPLAAALALLAALGVEVWLLAERPEHLWYEVRALAESSKTLAWRFAVGGLPFPIGMKDAAARFGEYTCPESVADGVNVDFDAKSLLGTITRHVETP